MDAASLFRTTAAGLNRTVVLPLLHTGPGRRVLGSAFAELTYTGRRTGRRFTLVTNYKRSGEQIVVLVAVPKAKTWWRNFTGDGAPITARLGTREVRGTAVAVEDEKGRVRVTITPA